MTRKMFKNQRILFFRKLRLARSEKDLTHYKINHFDSCQFVHTFDAVFRQRFCMTLDDPAAVL